MRRFHQVLLIVSTLAFSWLVMQAVHEAGHVLHAWLSGGEVVRVVLHPLALSRTDISPNPHPAYVAWGGIVWGSLLPLLPWGMIAVTAGQYAYLARFFAGFCLVANGAYFAAGAFAAGGDPGDLMRCGVPAWWVGGAGVPGLALGLCVWHGLGPRFGLGESKGAVDRRAAMGMGALAVAVAIAEVLFS